MSVAVQFSNSCCRGTDTVKDLSCEVFYLEPDGDAATGAAGPVDV
jgi:hypothetical protein